MEKLPHWIQARRSLLTQLKAQVYSRLGPPSEDLSHYDQEYEAEFKARWSLSSPQELQEQMMSTRLVLGADFHAFVQSQRTHLRLLRAFPPEKKVILALECFESRWQKWVDQYQLGHIDEEQLLQEVRWSTHWGFPWAHYRPLLHLARQRGYRVYGINRYFRSRTERWLAQRDQHAAEQIVRLIKKYPDHLIYVVFGELHLATGHLPQAIENRLATDVHIKPVILFQDSERLYFQVTRQNLEHQVEVLRASRNRFCWLTAPPWVKWQNYLMFLEETYDRDFEDGANPIDDTDHIHALIQFASRDLGLHLKVNDIEVHGSGDLHSRRLDLWLPAKQLKVATFYIKNDMSFYLPQKGFFYLSRRSLNHGATLAGSYIQAKLSGRSRPLWDMPSDFLPLIWEEGVSFFVSKLINHKRKANNLRVLKAQLKAMSPKDRGREVVQLVLDQRMSEVITAMTGRKRSRRFRPKDKKSYFQAAHILGQMLGERLYLSFRAGRISRENLLKFLAQDVDHPGFGKFYLLMVKRLGTSDRQDLQVESQLE